MRGESLYDLTWEVLVGRSANGMIARKPLEDRVWDLCVVGTGPVGMTLALEFNRIGDEMHRP